LELQSVELQAAPSHLLRAWWPALVWVGLIGVESTDCFSSANTSSFLYPFLVRVFGQIDPEVFFQWHYYLRKAGHVAGYGILALLLLRGWRATLARTRRWNRRPAIFAWLATAAVAAMDEWHQSFLRSRHGSVRDVALDSVAGLGFLLVAHFWLRRSERAVPKT
jgi:VanZ family protein